MPDYCAGDPVMFDGGREAASRGFDFR